MDAELVWYKTEIEKRFAKSETKNYFMPKVADKVSSSAINGPVNYVHLINKFSHYAQD